MSPLAAAERPRQAVILAGGRGERLLPLTLTRPKPMVEFHRRPFLAYLIELLRSQGFERVLLLLGYLPGPIIDHFGDGTGFGGGHRPRRHRPGRCHLGAAARRA